MKQKDSAYQTRLNTLRRHMQAQGLDAFIQPVNDEYLNEYVPAYARRLEWLTGFSGSAGWVAVLPMRAAMFTDGRYTLQAKNEVDENLFDLKDISSLSPVQWIMEQCKQHPLSGQGKIGYDPWLITGHTLRQSSRALEGTSMTLVPCAPNPIDQSWEDRPAPPSAPVENYPARFAGEDSITRRQRMAEELKKLNVEAAILSGPDVVNWILNIRGGDVPFTPLALCFGVLNTSGNVELFVDERKIGNLKWDEEVKIESPSRMPTRIAAYQEKRVLYDPARSPMALRQMLEQARAVIVEKDDPCVLAKACKNPVEVEGMRNAHIRDGAALSSFLCWLDKAVEKGEVTEIKVADQLLSFRQQQANFNQPSFPTIAGSGPHGAIVHYRADEKSNRALRQGELFLLDSGGQYLDGTTDVTRTIAIGEPTAEMRDRFTRVLKGHIALALARFPSGTTGSQLDVLARHALWQVGLDYDHGTGHGVGTYMNVHEGPQRISKRAGDAPLRPGMVISNEPGYYKDGQYGIRIENLVLVREAGAVANEKIFFEFDTITLVPIDRQLILPEMLNAEELDWLNAYHCRVFETLSPLINKEEKDWLSKACNKISN